MITVGRLRVRREHATLMSDRAAEHGSWVGHIDFDVFALGFGLLGFGGPPLHLGMIHLSNLFPGNKVLTKTSSVYVLYTEITPLAGVAHIGLQRRVRHQRPALPRFSGSSLSNICIDVTLIN